MATKTTTNRSNLSRMEIVSAMIEEQGLTKEELLGYLRQVMEIRAIENNIANLLSKAVLKGASHLYAGQEAVSVGAVRRETSAAPSCASSPPHWASTEQMRAWAYWT